MYKNVWSLRHKIVFKTYVAETVKLHSVREAQIKA